MRDAIKMMESKMPPESVARSRKMAERECQDLWASIDALNKQTYGYTLEEERIIRDKWHGKIDDIEK